MTTTNAKPSQENGLFCAIGAPDAVISKDHLRQQVEDFLSSLGERRDVLILPPDFTRYHSQAGVSRFGELQMVVVTTSIHLVYAHPNHDVCFDS